MKICDLCKMPFKDGERRLSFSSFRLEVHLHCVASSTGFTVAGPNERAFEEHCAKFGIAPPNIDDSWLYNLGCPDASCIRKTTA